jgi:hypothetical protein
MTQTMVQNLRRRLLTVAGISSALLGFAPNVHAQHGGGYVIPGALLGLGQKNGSGFGYGFELSGMYYPKPAVNSWFGYGWFFQIEEHELKDKDSKEAARRYSHFSLGGQIGGILGVELGAARLGATQGRDLTWAAQIGPYVSLGYVTMTARALVPVWSSGPEIHPATFSMVMGIKLPISFGRPPRISVPHGRPLTTSTGDRISGLVSRPDWS